MYPDPDFWIPGSAGGATGGGEALPKWGGAGAEGKGWYQC
jgi:hypothetical protein